LKVFFRTSSAFSIPVFLNKHPILQTGLRLRHSSHTLFMLHCLHSTRH